jgi:succinate-semialdehyde dehydrogenase/glutarate-semialdehyde dehydrogenase
MTLELGGSDPMIVMDDAIIPDAVSGALRGRFYNAGQTCTAVKRLYLHKDIAGSFIAQLTMKVKLLHLGNGLDPVTDMGPLQNRQQYEAISEIVETTKERGEGTVITGGSPLQGEEFRSGYFYQPTLVADVPPDSRLLTEEVFGPVLPIMTVPDLDTAIREANSTRFGLGASVWTRDIGTVKRVFREVRAGIIWVNRHLTVPPEIPLVGTMESGSGSENGYRAIDEYTRTRTLFIGW